MNSALSSDALSVLYIIICILATGFFSAAETAVTSVSALRGKIQSGDKDNPSMQLLLQHPSRVFTTILLFSNFFRITAALLVVDLVYQRFAILNLPLSVFLIGFVILILCDLVPKAIARAHLPKVAHYAMIIVYVLYKILQPLIAMLSNFANWIIRTLGSDQSLQPTITEAELEFLLEVGERSGVLEDVKKDMISGVFEFDETKVREIMTPRTDIIAVEKGVTLEETVRLIMQSGHSRLPVYDEQIDKVMGILFAKDVLKLLADPKRGNKPFAVTQIMREPQFVPESKHLIEIFKELKQSKNHMAVIIDEYGGTAGLVTMEDILEEIVGDIQDEFDSEEEPITLISENVFDVAGYVNISEFAEQFEIDESFAEDVEGEVDTIAGWMTQLLGHLPEIGQKVSYGNLTLEVTEVDRHRIERLRVIREIPPPKSSTEKEL
ncbi:MAG: HlyC/CorC family transporter [Proteobacteria bacterium]|nr:MAG: HlyC/CorC family transporter [Pseudomonadota bacterium]